MRIVAGYSFESTSDAPASAALAADVVRCLERWLQGKGELRANEGQVVLRDGRVAELTRGNTETTKGTISELSVTEPTGGGMFQTSVSIAHEPGRVAVSCEMSAGSQQLTPLRVDVHCPNVIRDILAINANWSYGGSGLPRQAQLFRGTAGGDAFINLVWDDDRSVPVVAVSNDRGLVLHPGIIAAMASDVAGLAVVAELDSDASWRVTSRKEKPWSCYGGAIRLYWPGVRDGSEPTTHPLWTAQRLLFDVVDTESAAARIRSQLRRRILGQSAFAVAPNPLFAAIRRAAREESLAGLQSKIEQGDNYRTIAEEYFSKLVELNEMLAHRDEHISDLKQQLANLQLTLRWRDETGDAVAPSEEAPPATVEEAVLTALERFGGNLLFGADVDESVRDVAQDAGPPDKIFNYLKALSQMADARRKGPIGTSIIKWLSDRGVTASRESETIRNSATEMRLRTWDDGCGNRREFELHLKPAEATSPDRCVRIYFDCDEQTGKVIVGWVGRHP